MNWSLVALDDTAPQPWRNGGGVTRELLAWPDAASWRVRLSVADVRAAGPFSAFPGIERWFAVLEGEGVALRVAGRGHRLTAADAPLCFDGAAAVDCALLVGPTRDFNLMAAPGTARMQRVAGSLRLAAAGPGLLAVYAHGTAATLAFAGQQLHLPPRHLAWCLAERPHALDLRATDALWIEAKP